MRRKGFKAWEAPCKWPHKLIYSYKEDVIACFEGQGRLSRLIECLAYMFTILGEVKFSLLSLTYDHTTGRTLVLL